MRWPKIEIIIYGYQQMNRGAILQNMSGLLKQRDCASLDAR
jgi:hypothetical protein